MATVQTNMTDYDAERQGFRWEVPDEFNFAVDVIGKWAADPRKEAVWWVGHDGQERHVTFAEFARRSSQAADTFSKLGIKKGDRVLVMLPRLVEWWEVVLGLMKLGAVPIPCTVLLTPKDIQFRAETAQPTAIITDNDNAPKYDEVRAQCPSIRGAILVGTHRPRWTSYAEVVAEGAPNFKPAPTKSTDPCLIYFTSGTVGYPKMVLHTHASYGIGHSITGKYWLDLRPDDLHWNVSEMGWPS
jgi:acyl-coenzyme A synthetase/AMP-(fatty) acid ligase